MLNKFNSMLVLEKWEEVYNMYERIWYTFERLELAWTLWDNEKQKVILQKISTRIDELFDEYTNKIDLTALILCLNHKIWHWYDKGTAWSNKLARLYDKQWKQKHWKISKKLKGDDLTWYYRTVD